ncbi:hypothetical protein [Aquisphaera insulae]|uniref:hypothetical protein n=1 Tax=Aquisphaera insulae TaxID=2712864 RepID=UPI0013EDF8FB|nr:hypothetical protein [Aquisphaera insulae]
MDCPEFDRRWDVLLDAETAAGAAGAGEPDIDHDLAGHAASCRRCGPIQARNLTLRRALRIWTATCPAPHPSAAMVDRIIASASATPSWSERGRMLPRRWLDLGVASAIAASLFVGVSLVPRPSPPAPGPSPRGPHLAEALAGATSATWGLARATTGEAAEFGRRVLEAAGGGEDRGGPDSTGDLAVLPEFPDLSSASAEPIENQGLGWLQDVGEGLSTSVRPLSTTAERAFGFLRVRAAGRPAAPSSSTSTKGA